MTGAGFGLIGLASGVWEFAATVTVWTLGEMMAVAFVVLIPPLLLFFSAQRLFIQGLVFTGVKG